MKSEGCGIFIDRFLTWFRLIWQSHFSPIFWTYLKNENIRYFFFGQGAFNSVVNQTKSQSLTYCFVGLFHLGIKSKFKNLLRTEGRGLVLYNYKNLGLFSATKDLATVFCLEPDYSFIRHCKNGDLFILTYEMRPRKKEYCLSRILSLTWLKTSLIANIYVTDRTKMWMLCIIAGYYV